MSHPFSSEPSLVPHVDTCILSTMPGWSDNTSEDDAAPRECIDTPTVNWNDGETGCDSVWADEPTVDEPANHFAQESYETPEPPTEPPKDEFGRATGTVMVRFHLTFQPKHDWKLTQVMTDMEC